MLSGIVYEKLISALIAARESTLALRAGNSEQENLKSEGKKKESKPLLVSRVCLGRCVNMPRFMKTKMDLGIGQKQVDFNFHLKFMLNKFLVKFLFIVKYRWKNCFKIKTPEFVYHLKIVASLIVA